MKDKVVLVYPRYDGAPLGPPLSLLSLAAPLKAAGFRPVIVDGALESDLEAAVGKELEGALCVGISFMTGRMIRSALAAARAVRRFDAAIPIVFGGWHASLLPDQTLGEETADVVVRGPGEGAMVELASALRAGADLEGIRAASFKRGGRPIHNAGRPAAPLESLPVPAFELARFDDYERAAGMRKLPYASSVGCPYACHYCTDQVFYDRRFNAYSARRVVSEVTDLVARNRLREAAFLDSNFLVNIRRALDIARGFKDARLGFAWTFQASTDLLCRMTDDEVVLLAESGAVHMGFGTESASAGVLEAMNKKHQNVEDMYETARKTLQAGIRATFNLILGYPGETEADRRETFRVMTGIASEFPNVGFSPNIFTPYPGIPIWPQLRALGVHEPRSLEEWADVDLGSNRLPWLQGEDLRRLRRMLEYFLLHNRMRGGAAKGSWLRGRTHRALGAPLRWRLRNSRYSFPLELWAARATGRLVSRRSLLTGQPLAEGVREVC